MYTCTLYLYRYTVAYPPIRVQLLDNIHLLSCIYMYVYLLSYTARNTPGQTQLSLHCTDSSGHQTILYTALFTYTLHDYQDLTERILQHAKDGLPLQSDLIPLLENPEDLVELDRSLTAVVCGLEQPLDWRASRDGEHGHVTAGRAEGECITWIPYSR